MSNSQCLPCYNTTFLKGNCQGVTNGGLIFTRNEPTQQELSVAMQTYKNNNVYRQHLIHNGHINMKNDIGLNINRTRCHYMNVPPKYGNEE